MIQKTVFVDRAWLHCLAMPNQAKAAVLREVLKGYTIVALETGGASALSMKLEQQEWLASKLYLIRSRDQRLFDDNTQNIAGHISNLEANGRLDASFRIYNARAGRMADSFEHTISYLYRMVCFACTLRADLLVSETRLTMLKALLAYHGVYCTHFEDGTVVGESASSDFSFLTTTSTEAMDARFITIADAGENSNATGTTEAQLKEGAVFLSYFHENKEAVRGLRDALIASGERVWWDQDILPGQDWKREIREALSNASACVLCFSEESQNRAESGVFPEALDAIEIYRSKRPGSIFLIPIRLSHCSIPSVEIDATRTLNRLQYIDLFPPERWLQNVDRLIAALRVGRVRPG